MAWRLPLYLYLPLSEMKTDVDVKSVDGSQSSRELEDLQKGRTDWT